MKGGRSLDEFTLILNEFLFNSGILGFYRIMRKVGKEQYLTIEGNTIRVKRQALENFTDDYFAVMMSTYEKETRWYRIVSSKWILENLAVKEEEEKLDNCIKVIKNAIESSSYKSGYEIAVKNGITEDPYQYLKNIQETKDKEIKKQNAIQIINYLEKNKEIFCMKDIIYNKINVFWNNIAFLNRSANKNDMKEEYQKSFVIPMIEYLDKQVKSDYNCASCGRKISKNAASSMSWLNDVGVDYKRKNSAFWGFRENTFLCPICNLIYSCVSLGFSMMGSNGLFVNRNDSVEMLIATNDDIRRDVTLEQDGFDNLYQKLFYNILNRFHQQGIKKTSKYEQDNIQVIKRDASDKNNPKYEFNLISKDKLLLFEKLQGNFSNILNKKIRIHDAQISIYAQVLNNFLTNQKQYSLLNILILKEIIDNIHFPYIKDIIRIQVYCIGGKRVNELETYVNEMIKEGEKLKGYFYANKENTKKLDAYRYKLGGALDRNSIETFMKVFTKFYAGLDIEMPRTKAIAKMMSEPEYFRTLGYAYVFGLGKYLDKKEENKEIEGGIEDEE